MTAVKIGSIIRALARPAVVRWIEVVVDNNDDNDDCRRFKGCATRRSGKVSRLAVFQRASK